MAVLVVTMAIRATFAKFKKLQKYQFAVQCAPDTFSTQNAQKLVFGRGSARSPLGS